MVGVGKGKINQPTRQLYMQEYIREYNKISINRTRLRGMARILYKKHILKQSIRTKLKRANIKREVLNVYSKGILKCSCCGETNIIFLTIDHENNNGNEERRKLGRMGEAFYIWLRMNNYPPGYKVSCMNCNWGRRYTINHICPHKLGDEV